MKKNIFLLNLIIFCVFVLFLGSCKKDNYAPPQSVFSGRVVYNGNPIGVKNNNGGTVYFELWQPGYGKSGAIQVFLNQDGAFSSLLFDGDYKLVIPTSQGPFMSIVNAQTQSDTIPLTISGNKTMDIDVLPYYVISNATFSLARDSTVSGSCQVSKIITNSNAKDISNITLYVNRTAFVDDDNNIAQATVAGNAITDLNNIQLSTKIPVNIANANVGVASQNYFYARIGIKINGIDDMLFSVIQKISF